MQKYCNRNGSCIVILFRSIGVRARFDSPDFTDSNIASTKTPLQRQDLPVHRVGLFLPCAAQRRGRGGKLFGMQSFCLRLEASCLQFSFFAYRRALEPFTYSRSFFADARALYLQLELLWLTVRMCASKHLNRL